MKRLFDDVDSISKLKARYLLELASIPNMKPARYTDAEEEINRQYEAAERRIRRANSAA